MTSSKRRPVHADRLALGAWIAVALTPAGWVLGIVLAFLSGEGEAKGIGPVTPGMAAGLLFADGDISAKLVGYGGLWLVALASLIIAYAVGTSVLQWAYQRGDTLTAAGLATMATNAVPIAAAGFVLFGETLVPAPVDQAVHPQPRGVVDPAPHGTGSGHHDVRPGRGLCGGTRPLLRRAVDVLGVSTGGSIALQFAADHSGVVRRLVLVSSGCRLGPRGRQAQRQIAGLLRRASPRQAGAVLVSMLGASPVSQRTLAGVGWLLGTRVVGRGDPDLLATIEAEDAFDLTQRLGSITQPTLVVGGDRDAFYGSRVFQETAALLPRRRDPRTTDLDRWGTARSE